MNLIMSWKEENLVYTVAIWTPNGPNPKTFEYQMFWRSVFKWSIHYSICLAAHKVTSGPSISAGQEVWKTQILNTIWTFEIQSSKVWISNVSRFWRYCFQFPMYLWSFQLFRKNQLATNAVKIFSSWNSYPLMPNKTSPVEKFCYIFLSRLLPLSWVSWPLNRTSKIGLLGKGHSRLQDF